MDIDSEIEDAEFRALADQTANEERVIGQGAGVTWALLAIANRIDRLITVVSVKP